jgi:hypothetical protein
VAASADLDKQLLAEFEVSRPRLAATGSWVDSFSLTRYGLPQGHSLTLRMVCAANARPFHHSDVMYLERLHSEAIANVVSGVLTARLGDA